MKHLLLGFLILGVFLNSALLKADEIEDVVIPQLEFVDTPVRDALTFIHSRSLELSPDGSFPDIALIGPYEGETLTLKLRNIPSQNAIEVIAELIGAKVSKSPTCILVSHTEKPGIKVKKGSESNQKMLSEIVVPHVEFVATPIADALEFLGSRSKELSPNGNPGVNLVLNPKPADPKDSSITNRTITLKLRDAKLQDILELVAFAAGCEIEIREHLVMIQAISVKKKSSGATESK